MADIARLARNVGDSPRVEVRLSGDFDDLNPSVGAALYRIAQEAITNAVRHARHATQVVVHIADTGEHVRLTVHDDGVESTTGHTSSGYGLAGMAERVNLLGGTLEAGRTPDAGWTVEAALPKGRAT